MIGNDVIDLRLTRLESDIYRLNYLSKTLTKTELQLVEQVPQAEIMYWVIWSMKESAYKILNRKTGIRAFNPLKFECEIDTISMLGIVMFGNDSFYTKSIVSDNLITTEGCSVFERLNEVTVVNPLKIIKKQNLPFVEINGRFMVASVSHHGEFTRAVYLPNA